MPWKNWWNGLGGDLSLSPPPPPPPPPPLPAPLLNWKFATDNADSSGNGYDGTTLGGSPTYGNGVFGCGVAGANFGIRTDGPVGSSVPESGPVSLSFWVGTPAGVPTGDVQWIDGGGLVFGWGTGPGENHAYANSESGGPGVADISLAALSGGVAHHVALVIGADQVMRLYQDGVEVGTADASGVSGTLDGTFTVYAGANDTWIADVIAVDAELTAGQVALLYSGGSPYLP